MFPKISVVTVVYNAEKTVERTIRSVIEQKYEKLEYIVIDGGSTDETVNIIKKYSDFITYWVSEPDGGIYDAMNKGIALATGDYICFLNADDWFCRRALHTVATFSEGIKADVLVGNIVSVDGTIKQLEYPKPLESILWGIPTAHQAFFVKTSCVGSFDTQYRIAADYKMLLDLSLSGKTIHYVPYSLVYFSLGGFSDQWYESSKEVYEISKEAILKSQIDNKEYYLGICNRIWLRKQIIHDVQNDDFALKVTDYIRELLPDNKEIIIWGTGGLANSFSRVIEIERSRIKYFVDNDESKWGENTYGCMTRNPLCLGEERNVSIFVLNELNSDEILDQILDMGLDESVEVFDYNTVMFNYENEVIREL